jgi:hypothetical protein
LPGCWRAGAIRRCFARAPRRVRRYAVPIFLISKGIDQEKYERWLRHKAHAHVKRDRERVAHEISQETYRGLIHNAVCASEGLDFYTGESLEWEKISSYSNDESKAARSVYKASLARLPTADHVLLEDGRYDFVICGWRTNDAKGDLGHSDFVELCRRVIAHYDNSFTATHTKTP